MKKIIPILTVLLIVLFSSCQKESAPPDLTTNETEEIAISLIEKSLDVYDKLMGLSLDKYGGDVFNGVELDVIKHKGVTYYTLIDFTTIDELWSFAQTAFTKQASERIFSVNIEGDELYIPKFIRQDGFLYMAKPYHTVEPECYKLKAVTITEVTDNTFTAIADFYYTYAIMRFSKGENGWRLENSVAEGEKEYIDSVSDTESYSVLTENLTLNTEGLIPSDTLSFEEAKNIFVPLLQRCTTVYHGYINNAPLWNMGKLDADLNINGVEYFFVEYPQLKSISDVWYNAYCAYTKDAAQRLFSRRLDANSDTPRYIEKGEKLYFNNYAHGYYVGYSMSSLELTAQYENALVFTIDEYVMQEFETKRVFVLQKTADGWRMANGFDEIIDLSCFTEFNGIELTDLSESKTFAYAQRNQDVFSASFSFNGNKICVNAPIFTGLKTKNVYTYKKFFAFENSQIVVSVLPKNDTVKYFLLDKSGRLTDSDFDSPSIVNDKAAISKYPDGIKVIQEGAPGSYQQYLATANGEILSEGFDEIGFFNLGIAIVRRDNKIGFISTDGKTLLDPSIEIDDLRYTPDYYRCYQVNYLTDDAFIVPIDGELAIITLERTKNH